MVARKKIRTKKKAPEGPAPARTPGSIPNPLEERSRYPHEGTPPEQVNPSPQSPIEEPEPTELEGQEGVGPGPRDAIRRREQGQPDPEEDS